MHTLSAAKKIYKDKNLLIKKGGIYIQSTYLVHHGVKGQKWGVRRYDNESYESRARRLLGNTQQGKNYQRKYDSASKLKKYGMNRTIKKATRGLARLETKHSKIEMKRQKRHYKIEQSKQNKLKGVQRQDAVAILDKYNKKHILADRKAERKHKKTHSTFRAQALRTRVLKMMGTGYSELFKGFGKASAYQNVGNRTINRLMNDKIAHVRLAGKTALNVSGIVTGAQAADEAGRFALQIAEHLIRGH